MPQLYQHRPQTVSIRFVGTTISQKRFLGTPYLLPLEQIALSMTFVGIDIANCSAIREDKRTGGQDPVTEPGHRVQGRGQSVCPGLVSAARGQEKDKRRARPGHRARPQSAATEPGHRVQGRGQSVWPAIFF